MPSLSSGLAPQPESAEEVCVIEDVGQLVLAVSVGLGACRIASGRYLWWEVGSVPSHFLTTARSRWMRAGVVAKAVQSSGDVAPSGRLARYATSSV